MAESARAERLWLTGLMQYGFLLASANNTLNERPLCNAGLCGILRDWRCSSWRFVAAQTGAFFSMAWIESHCELRNHPKVIRMMACLGIGKAAAIGHLHMLWWWAITYTKDGDMSQFSDAEIATACEWTGDEKLFVEALINSKLLDLDRRVHDWKDYCGKLLAYRERERERKKNFRRTSAGHPQDVCRTSQVPYRTVPTKEKTKRKLPETRTHSSDANGHEIVIDQIPVETRAEMISQLKSAADQGEYANTSEHKRTVSNVP